MDHDKQVYFETLNKTLKEHDRALPFLIIDLDRLDKNIASFSSHLHSSIDFRMVVKSLPIPKLLEYINGQLKGHKYMVFHQPFLSQLSSILNKQADILWGKPMPIQTAAYYFEHLPSKTSIDPFRQIQWLVDTEERTKEYIALAKSLGKPLRLNIEIDVGLHRGGINNLAQLGSTLQIIRSNKQYVSCSGLMGYEPHIIKIPSLIRSQQKSVATSFSFYERCKRTLHTEYSDVITTHGPVTYNGGGSPTITIHNENSPINDISAGSCFLKPTDFDIANLDHYLPACFIATPVLKKMVNTTLPGIEGFKKVLNIWHKKYRQSFFIYGGFWKADYCYPKGAQSNKIFGPSTNQSMLNAPPKANIQVGDFIFLRPHQSEFVLLQFGDVLALRNGKIVDVWSPFVN